MSFYRLVALSDRWPARLLRRAYTTAINFSLPAPKFVVAPFLGAFLLCRSAWYFLYRVLVCEPFLKFYCRSYGKNLHTGPFIHGVHGEGDLILGHNVTVDGKCGFTFAVRFTERPTLRIGDNSGIGHLCSFTVAKEIAIGRNCRISAGVRMFDSPGHPLNPEKRKAGLPPGPDDVRPITIADNVWIGVNAVIFPGVSIGENSVVGVGSVVMNDVQPNVMVMGNPARRVMSLERPDSSIQPSGWPAPASPQT